MEEEKRTEMETGEQGIVFVLFLFDEDEEKRKWDKDGDNRRQGKKAENKRAGSWMRGES